MTKRQRPFYLVYVERRICEPCRMGSHECCEPLPFIERGLTESKTYVDCACLCNPEWMNKTYDSEGEAAR